jgi:hypothetical protein
LSYLSVNINAHWINKEVWKVDVKYVEKALKGKACKDCKFFENTGGGMGKCFGHEVLAQGGGNIFEAKQK